METKVKKEEFSFIRSILFPVHWHELKAFVPMALMMLFILCNYTILRNVKDTLVVNANGSDAEIISFLKLWGTMPSAFLFILLYSKLTNLFSREKIFYLCLFPFIIFFGAFAFVIYPNLELLHPNPTNVANLMTAYPNVKWFIAIWGNWSYALFYILAELWGSVILSLLFWQFANDIVKKEETKRFYPLFGMVANVGLVIAGSLVKYFSQIEEGASDPWQQTLNYLMPIVFISGMIIAVLFYQINRTMEKVKNEFSPQADISAKPPKTKLSIIESFRLLLSSKHLLCIAVIVLGYGVSINYVDVIWKGQVKAYFAGNHNAYSDYMGSFAITTGLLAIPIMLIGGNILRFLSWRNAALITPTILLLTGFGFFSLIWLGNYAGNPNALLMTVAGMPLTFLGMGVQFGMFQNALTKATKYSLFDPTKEMAYIPLDKEFKTKGKAAVDVVGSRLGKSGGALTFFLIQTIVPGVTMVEIIPLLAAATLVILFFWFTAAFKLDTSIKAIEKSAEKQEAETAAKAVTQGMNPRLKLQAG